MRSRGRRVDLVKICPSNINVSKFLHGEVQPELSRVVPRAGQKELNSKTGKKTSRREKTRELS